MPKTRKRETVEVFRHRLAELIARSGLTRAKFAEKAGLDRSTLSLLLGQSAVRLPRTETIAKIAAQHNSSVDWLLGLAQQDKVATDIVPQLEIETAAGSPVDIRLQRWREEATGFKIRYVPTTLPDLLKSDEVIDYEYAARTGPRPALRQEAAQSSLEYTRKPETDMEVCSSFQSIVGFARGEGVWSDLDRRARIAQIERMARLTEELYPTFRWFLFDGLEQYSSSYTVFGPKRAAIYIGEMYFVFTSTQHIRELTRHFDDLIRHARIQPHDCARYLRELRGEVR